MKTTHLKDILCKVSHEQRCSSRYSYLVHICEGLNPHIRKGSSLFLAKNSIDFLSREIECIKKRDKIRVSRLSNLPLSAIKRTTAHAAAILLHGALKRNRCRDNIDEDGIADRFHGKKTGEKGVVTGAVDRRVDLNYGSRRASIRSRRSRVSQMQAKKSKEKKKKRRYTRHIGNPAYHRNRPNGAERERQRRQREKK